MSEQLKSCPFCGGNAEIHKRRRDECGDFQSIFSIGCSNGECLASTAPVCGPWGYPQQGDIESDVGAKARAIAVWNRRPDTRAMGASAVTDEQILSIADSHMAWGKVCYVNADKRNVLAFARALLAQPESPAASTQEDGAGEPSSKADNYPTRLLHESDKSLAWRVDEWHKRNPQPSTKTLTDEQIEDLLMPLLVKHLSGKALHYVTYNDGTSERPVTDMRALARALLAAQPSEDKRDKAEWIAANAPGGWIDDLRKDAERYQWIRDDNEKRDGYGTLGAMFRDREQSFDDAIDAAIAKGEGK